MDAVRTARQCSEANGGVPATPPAPHAF